MAENINANYTQATVGLNTDNGVLNIHPGMLTYALNANVQNFDGNSITYQNDQANVGCVTFPAGYHVIGIKNIPQISTVMYWLTNPTTGHSQIGVTVNHSCTYTAILDDTIAGSDLLGFNVLYPILGIEVKTTNCSTQVYWTDKFTPRSFIDLDNLPWKEMLVGTTSTPLVGQISREKMLIQPHFSIPEIDVVKVDIGGILKEGTYQFAVQYADVLGNGYTSFYSVTNPVRIFLDHKISNAFDDVTNKSITLKINRLDTTGLYDYFNLAVIKTINNVHTVQLVGTFNILRNSFDYNYTGNEAGQANIKLTMADIFQKQEYYDLAGDVTQADNTIIWADLVKEEDIAMQKVCNQLADHIFWETWRVPYTQSESYSNGANCANFQSFMRDEVYPLELVTFNKNGRILTRNHLPGRNPLPYDLDYISVANHDTDSSVSEDVCTPPSIAPQRWQVYNTGVVLNTSPSYDPADSCYKGPYQYGLMGYHQSTRTYPNNPHIWGALAGQPIRHHRFPDSLITHIHDENPFPVGSENYNNFDHAIYPIGIKIDVDAFRNAIIASTDLTQAQKDQIAGFRILRGDRTNNKSVIAKGMMYNCGYYEKEGSKYYYPNYPYNDVNPDQFISSVPVDDKSGAHENDRLNAFQKNRFTFHSPDTHFFRPSGIQNSFVKLETAEYGNCKAHFVQVKENAGEKIKTKKDLEIALAAAILSMIGIEGSFSVTTGAAAGLTTTVSPVFNPNNFFPTFNNMLDIIDKLIPYYNYGWQYNSVGYYGNYKPIPNNGDKIRGIVFGGYLVSGLQGTFGDDHSVNNTNRESSVYLGLKDDVPFPFQNVTVPADDSRVTAGAVGLCGSSNIFYRNISAYYGSIKRYLPDQWGEIFSYNVVDTGYATKLYDENNIPVSMTETIFGGDVFINRFGLKRKHSFFLKSTVNKPDGTDIDYNQDAASHTNTGNVGYPIWYYSTMNNVLTIDNTAINNAVNLFMTSFQGAGILLTIVTGGLFAIATAANLMVTLINQGLLKSLGLKITNLECYDADNLFERGQAYLYAYGIPYYFVESEVNVDMRQAINSQDGNFFPQVGTDIPDDWLQETNVSIRYDNTYVYNKTYSKQNKEQYYATLRADWSPDKPCFVNFPNRAIWSDKASLEETKNNWLMYKPGNTHDFPKTFGKLMAIDKANDRAVLVRYENKSQLYNATVTLATSTVAASIGTGDLFTGTPPLDLSETDTGSAGTQHKFFLKTEQGYIWVDAKRGQVLLLNGNQPVDLSERAMDKLFSEILPFKILESFPECKIDNNYQGIGLHGVYDNLYKRVIITKLDYEPIKEGIKYDPETNTFYREVSEEITREAVLTDELTTPTTSTFEVATDGGTLVSPFPSMTCCPDGYVYGAWPVNPKIQTCYQASNPQSTTDPIACDFPEPTPPPTPVEISSTLVGRIPISLNDEEYFCNRSWTLSYSFVTNTWISWHSFLPNFYVAHENYFQSGLNSDVSSLWNHNIVFTDFNKYYDVLYPYILEYPFVYKYNDEILQNVKDYCTVLKYSNQHEWTEPKEMLYFNKAIIANGQQCTGLLNLIPKSSVSLYQYIRYPILNTNSKDIILDKRDHFYNFNQFWNIVKDPSVDIWKDSCGTQFTNRLLHTPNLDYGIRSYTKQPLRGKDCRVRLILDDRHDIKLISKFIVAPSQNSYN